MANLGALLSWGAAAGGLNQGLDNAAQQNAKLREEALKRAALDLEAKKLDIEKNKDFVDIPTIDSPMFAGINQKATGPTAPGSATGLGALLPPDSIEARGLSAIAPLAGSKVHKNLLDVYQEQVKPTKPNDDWAAKLAIIEAGKNARQSQAIGAATDRFNKSQEQRQTEKLIEGVNKGSINDLFKSFENLNAVTGGFMKTGKLSPEILAAFPSGTTTSIESKTGELGSSAINLFRTPKEQQIATAIQAILNPQIRSEAGLSQTSGEALRVAISKARTGDSSELSRLLKRDYDELLEKRDALGKAFPMARKGVVAGDVYRGKINASTAISAPDFDNMSEEELMEFVGE